MKPKGLGRGLDALLSAGNEKRPDEQRELPIDRLRPGKYQPRSRMDEASLAELAASIRAQGIMQPILVRPLPAEPGQYEIIAGERRFRAARLAGLTEVPVLAVDYDDAEIHEVSLIENIQREDLNPIEEASAIRFLMQQHDMTQEEVSARLGKSRPAVANALRLLQLPERVVDMLKDGALSAGHGRALAGLDDPSTIEKLADESVRMGYSVRALESRIKNLAAPKAHKERKAPAQSADLASAEESMRERLGTRVKIAGDEKKGRIVIEYYSAEDLERVYEQILRA